VRSLAALLLLVVPASAARSGRYAKQELHGWTLRVHSKLLSRQPERRAEFEAMIEKLDAELGAAAAALPPGALARLRETTLWAVHDPSRDSGTSVNVALEGMLVIDGKLDGALAGGIVLINPRYFRDHPYRMLLLLARAYYERLEPAQRATVASAYEDAMARALYARPGAPGTGPYPPAGADAKTYFSALTEAYFAESDQCPRTRAELFAHDERGLRAIESVWGAAPPYASGARAASPCAKP
jgi:hypothetical protein